MKKLLAIPLAITILILTVGCSINSPPADDLTGNTSAITETGSTGTDFSNTGTNFESSTDQTDETPSPTTSSTIEGTESNPTTSAPPETSTSGNTEPPTETSKPNTTDKVPETTVPPAPETSKPTTDTPEESKPTESSKPEETDPPETSKPEDTTPPETSVPEVTDPPKSAYEYPFDIEQICRDCIAIAESYGMRLDESLNKNNSSWANPDPASPNTQGARLKRLLSETIEYYTDDYREAMGLTLLHISSFNIYCEPTGDGSYLIYFLH